MSNRVKRKLMTKFNFKDFAYVSKCTFNEIVKPTSYTVKIKTETVVLHEKTNRKHQNAN